MTFDAKIIKSSECFSDLVNFYCESSTFCGEACGSTGVSGVRRKFSWGVSFNGIWWSFLFAVRCLWRHKMTSYSCFQTNVLRSLLT